MMKCIAGSAAAGLARSGRLLRIVLCVIVCSIAAGGLVTGCVRPKEIPRVVPAEGLVLPAVSALAWLGTEDSPGGPRFVSVSEDGIVREWEALSGRLLSSRRLAESDGIAHDGTGGNSHDVPNNSTSDTPADVLFDTSELQRKFPVRSPDGTKDISPSDDGAICLSDAASGKELARYYAFSFDEWISIVPEGFYNGSFRGSSFLEVIAGKRRYGLLQLSGALFRPDLFSALVRGEKAETQVSLESLFTDGEEPPLVSFPGEGRNGEPKIKVKITGQKGGVGWIALYRRTAGSTGAEEISAGLFDAETAARKYSENGNPCYEIDLDADSWGGTNSGGTNSVGVSAFNKSNTVESGRRWLDFPAKDQNPPEEGGDLSQAREPSPSPHPVLRALLAAGDAAWARENAEALENSLLLQREGALYSAVDVKSLYGGEFTRTGFVQSLGALCAGSDKGDVLFLYIRGAGSADARGDLLIGPAEQGASGGEISGDDILKAVLNVSANPVIILDTVYSIPKVKMETALLRFRQKLGPRAMFASFLAGASWTGGEGDPVVRSVIEGLGPDLSGGRFIGGSGFFARAGGTLAGQGISPLVFNPLEDFRIADVFINSGELKFQTMASGMLKIDQVDKNPVPLAFGETMIRRLSAGSYIIDMVYRNGYRETRMVELRKNDSAWVIFNYTPPLLTGDFIAGNFPRGLPSLGINLRELDPANYGKIDREAMEGMGMAPYYVAFLSGEKFYKEGNYDKAIAEYSRAISLKADYAEAYVSRGNARRKKGEVDRAIEDYTRALSFKSDYAEVYNYRGFMYAQKGDLSRAIEDYTQAIRRRADYGDAYFNRAYAYGQQGNWDKAAADYTQLLKLEPSNAVAYGERGKAFDAMGEKEKAAADYAAAGKLKR